MRKCIPGFTTLAAIVGLLASVSAAHAQFFDFSAVFQAANPPLNGAGTLLTFGPGGSTVGVTNGSNVNGLNSGGLGTDIQVTNFGPTNSSTPDATPDTFNFPYTVKLTITASDNLGNPIGAPDTHNGSGVISGSISQNQTNNGPPVFTFASLVFVSGGNVYTVTPKAYTGFPAPRDNNLGALQYHVQGAPEPGSMALLAGLGISGSLFALRLRRRK